MDIQVNDVSKIYGTGENKVVALRHANMTIHSGDFISIMGPSGSGKSTFRRQKIGFIFQQFNLLPVLTAQENIIMPLLLDKRQPDNAYLQEIAAFLGIDSRLNHLPHELSGGQQQRVAIARALIAKPDIIFADEPTGNLDTKSGSEVMEMLCDLRAKMNKTLIVITHDPDIAEMAERRFTIIDGVLSEVTVR